MVSEKTDAVHVVVHSTDSEDINELQSAGQYEAVVKKTRQILKANPYDKETLINLADALGNLNSPEANMELRRLATQYPEEATIQASLARMLVRRGEDAEAIEHFDRATRLAPKEIFYRLELATLYDREGQGTRALSLYRQILQSEGDDDVSVENRAIMPLTSNTLVTIRHRVAYLEALEIGE
jgi:thioredoxin-like negative regulator of GroEL